MGVGISGLIDNLPGTITPYPTQDPLLELGGYRSVANAAARDAIPANFRVIGMQVTLQDTGVTYQLVGGITNAHYQAGGGAPQAFTGLYFVNSTFAGVQTGSQSNPFTTVAAAFAFAASLGILNFVVTLGQNHTENITFPLTGDVELIGANQASSISIFLTGTVDISCSGTRRRALTNITFLGAVSGNSSSGNARARFLNCGLNSTTTLTISGAGTWKASFAGLYAPQFNQIGGFATGLVSIAGVVTSLNFSFLGGLTIDGAAAAHEFSLTSFGPAAITFATTGHILSLINKCEFDVGISLVSTGTNTLKVDGSSWPNLCGSIPVFTGTWTVKTITANFSDRRVIAANALIPVSSLTQSGQMTITATLTLLAAGTLGIAQVQVDYTDLLGTPQSRVLGAGVNIAAAAGTEFSDSLTFVSNGSGISCSVIGITTPGALSLSVAVNIKAEY